jgi:hypothetical protein
VVGKGRREEVGRWLSWKDVKDVEVDGERKSQTMLASLYRSASQGNPETKTSSDSYRSDRKKGFLQWEKVDGSVVAEGSKGVAERTKDPKGVRWRPLVSSLLLVVFLSSPFPSFQLGHIRLTHPLGLVLKPQKG